MIYECEQCGAILRAGAVSCTKCGDTFDVAVPDDAEAPKVRRKTRPGPVLLQLIVLVGALLLIGVMLHLHSSGSDISSAQLSAGDEAILTGQGPDIVAATSEQAETDLNDALTISDSAACANIVKQGHAFHVPNNTHVILIGYGTGLFGASLCQVRLQSGPHAGQEVWVSKSQIAAP